jgi:hypothetical protein
MNWLDKTATLNSITVNIGDLQFLETELQSLVNSIWKEALRDLLSKYYVFRLTQYLNAQDYKSIEKLEGILDLINQIG